MTNIKKFDLRLLSINQISFKSTHDVVYDMKSSDGANSLYLVRNNVDPCIDCNSTGGKYLIFVLQTSRKALEIYTELLD